MKVQQIGNYTTQYSSNKTQKSNNNPNFGIIADVKAVRVPLGQRLGAFLRKVGVDLDNIFCFRPNHASDAAHRISGFERFEDVMAIQAHCDALTERLPASRRQDLRFTVQGNGSQVTATVAMKGSQNRLGYSQVSGANSVKTAQRAASDAFGTFLTSTI